MLTQGCGIAHTVIVPQPWRLRLRSRRTCIAAVSRQFIPKPESTDLSCGLEFDEAVGLKRPNLRRSCRLGLLSPTFLRGASGKQVEIVALPAISLI